ncbi:MAG: hypothetical protein ABII99_01050 [Patescibacteria group bacterium]|nr:hypothetical protein [Patescibacteria group bacterium]MBU1420926.1 hypothetical protein [Patescibacteria group bacterium]MBU2456581.1 hypothetical protein [Patescibacteria group bacterium]MBU2474725.1 hypothetical protein [Patescibacteria group bacterium]
MDLYINTTKNNSEFIEIALKKGAETAPPQFSSLCEENWGGAVSAIKAKRMQAEKLLPAIDKLLKKNKIKLSDIKKIQVENQGGSFTALRIGVVTANALGYALGIPVEGTQKLENRQQITDSRNQKSKNNFSVVEPIYTSIK